ncbi:hypothetical protein SSP531S_55600 [Streptomyces spongiicola]|uniref:Uncharacterized protein n=1 Tax=Streptomyces spongiicola TaxID=1690221 RepID=A0A388T7K4_9ACTN|nr:hypothetical protein SSP531S_55600 [Streptomyces spongiicola]
MGAQFGGEAEDGLDDGLRPVLPAGRPAGTVQHAAVRPDEGGLHPGAAHIEGDDVSHAYSLAAGPEKV